MRPGQLREETPDVSSGGTTGTAVLPRRRPRPGTLYDTLYPSTSDRRILYSLRLHFMRSLAGLRIEKQLSQVMC